MSERGPITAELRRVMNHTTMAGVPLVEIGEYEFGHRCDAIDAVHAQLELENAELRERVAVLDNERGNMHDGWVLLPLDANGVPFHIGELVDEMLPFGGYAAPAPIDTMELSRGASGYVWMVKLDAENRALISPKLLRHHAHTVEDVLREFADKLSETHPQDMPARIAEYAAKLTLAEGEDA